MLLTDLIYWLWQDAKQRQKDRKSGVVKFQPYGLRMYCGKQGSGKTVALVNQLDIWRKVYPDAVICTNFDYKHAHYRMTSLNDLLVIRNGLDGVIFAIDELQNEFSSATSRDFPEALLSVITMQRKQRIVILCTSQVFTRVSKPLREQCYEIVECRTFWGRLTRLKCYDAIDYNDYIERSSDKKLECPRKWRRRFVQTDELRQSYDTWAVVERLSRDNLRWLEKSKK